MINRNKNQSGFALLLSLLVVSVVISVGLSLLDLTIKQLRLSTGAKDSESAFHAANAGVECLRYWRRKESDKFENGTAGGLSISCFGTSDTVVMTTLYPYIYKYDVKFTWGSSPQRCSQLSFITMSSDPTSSGLTLNGITGYIPGYPYGDSKTCPPGGKCTIASSRGYNQGCGSTANIGIVQREVLLEL